MAQGIFYGWAALSLLGALGVLLAPDPLRAALCLASCLLVLAALYLGMGAPWVGLLQVLLYVGAILVLLLFVLMLLSLDGPPVLHRRPAPLKLLAGAGVLGLGGLFAGVAPLAPGARVDGSSDPVGTVAAVGVVLFQRYLLHFEVVSLLLLVALVGAVALGKRRL